MLQIPEELIERLLKASHVVVATGAGVSAESGVPTFRGENGIWKKMNPEELASINGFMANPDLVWEWYQYRRQILHECQPNPGHHAIAAMENFCPHFTLVTQNVDGLHARAGSKHIVELHGNIGRNKCFDCGKLYTKEIALDQALPRCSCGGMVRPDVVWFGEMLPEDAITAAFEAAEACNLFFAVGTSAIVQPAASLPLIASRSGAYVVEVNLEKTALTPIANLFLQGKSGEVLPQVVELLNARVI